MTQEEIENNICAQCIGIKIEYINHEKHPEYFQFGSVRELIRQQAYLKRKLLGNYLALFRLGKSKGSLLDKIEDCYTKCSNNIPYEVPYRK